MKPLPHTDLEEVATRCADAFRALEGAHVLITGATGFIGSWLADSLCWVRRESRMSLRLTVASRRGALGVGESRVIGDTWCVSADIRSLTIHDGVTHVIHCASAASQAENDRDPSGVCNMITEGTRRVVAECERVGVKRLLHLSSGSVYANGDRPTEGSPRRTNTGKSNADWFAFAKVKAEDAVLASDVPAVVARVFALLGPRLPAQFAAAEFMEAASCGRPIEVRSPGTVRSYLYAADLAAWLWTLLVKGDAGTAYNVGGGYGGRMHVSDLAHYISFPAGVPVVSGTGESAPRFVPDTTRAELLGLAAWTPVGDAARRWWAWERGT